MMVREVLRGHESHQFAIDLLLLGSEGGVYPFVGLRAPGALGRFSTFGIYIQTLVISLLDFLFLWKRW